MSGVCWHRQVWWVRGADACLDIDLAIAQALEDQVEGATVCHMTVPGRRICR